MKSSIFLRDSGTPSRRQLPRPSATGAGSLLKPRKPAPLPLKSPARDLVSGPKRAPTTWTSLDELILHYTATGGLPPILSPTLPKEFERAGAVAGTGPGSATVNSAATGTTGSNGAAGFNGSGQRSTSAARNTVFNSDDEDIPLGLLQNAKSISASPRPLHLPVPRKPHQQLLLVPKSVPAISSSTFVPSGTLHPTPLTSRKTTITTNNSTNSSTTATTTSSGTASTAAIATPQPKVNRLKYVRWVNRLADPNKPRLVLRIVFQNKTAAYEKLVENTSIKKDPSHSSSAVESDSASPPPVGLGIYDKKSQVTKRDSQLHNTEHVLSIRNLPPALVPPTPNIKQKTASSSLATKQTSPSKPSTSNSTTSQKQASPVKATPLQPTFVPLILPPKIQSFVTVPNSISVKNGDKTAIANGKSNWLKLAKETKAKVPKARNRIQMTLAWLDGLLVQMVANDYDERLKLLNDVLPSERLWRNMLDDINDFIKTLLHEKEKNKQHEDFYTLVQCMLYHTNALVLKRINNILTKVIDLYTKRNDNGTTEITNKVVELQHQVVHNANLILDYLLSGNPNYMMSTISSKFPKTWYHRTNNIQNLTKQVADLRPTSNTYYLPLGSYSSLSDISALTHNILREFIETNSINYVLICSQKGT